MALQSHKRWNVIDRQKDLVAGTVSAGCWAGIGTVSHTGVLWHLLRHTVVQAVQHSPPAKEGRGMLQC